MVSGVTDTSGYLKIALGSGGTISGDQTFTGNVTIQGNLTFGDAAVDTLDINGNVTHTPVAIATGVTVPWTFTGATDTGMTASTERPDYKWDGGRTVTWATGAIASQRQYQFLRETLAFAGASTITNAATVYIDNAPAVGANATITNAYSFWIDAGTMRYDDNIALGTVLATMGNVPAGGTAAQNEWIRISVAGNVRYIPCWA